MKIVIINKSDSTGGAAVVSRRLMEAFRLEGIDARMLVCEKFSDSPFVELAASPGEIKRKFLIERLKVFLANGFNRTTLFKIDTGEEGLPLWRHPSVVSADAIMINWVNQGMLSIKGIKKILSLGKPVIITMHDMWWLTGICHHAGECLHFLKECGNCPLLQRKASSHDLSHKIWERKFKLYSQDKLLNKTAFVAVSSWLKEKALGSSLLSNQRVELIPNAFPIDSDYPLREIRPQKEGRRKIRLLFGAARLDDPIKGLDTFKEASRILKSKYSDEASNIEIVLFGGVKDPDALQGFSLPMEHLGILKGDEKVRQAYEYCDILVSASSYETLPGTLVEAQAYGCIPVSFNQGGQSDIISTSLSGSSLDTSPENDSGQSNLCTGRLVEYSEDFYERADNLAKGIIDAIKIIGDPHRLHDTIKNMRENVEKKFSYPMVVKKYLSLIHNLQRND